MHGDLPGSSESRQFEIAGHRLRLPTLTPEHMEYILSLDRPRPQMTLQQNIECRLKIAHGIVSPFFPEMTMQFLEENLSIPDTDALWRLVFPTKE